VAALTCFETRIAAVFATAALAKGCALGIPLKSSGIWKPEVRSQLTAGLQDPFSGDANLPDGRINNLDKLYLGVSAALDNLPEAVGLEAA
jgi:hypothetical protein